MNESDELKAVQTPIPESSDEILVPLLAEEIAVSKQVHATGRVRVSTVTREHEELVDELLAREQVVVERVPVGRPVDSIPPVREVGDTIIVPVVEEQVVIERRFFLKEEVHIKRVRGTEHYQERVKLHKQEAFITRLTEATAAAAGSPVAGNSTKDGDS